jgi:hypothetical protein
MLFNPDLLLVVVRHERPVVMAPGMPSSRDPADNA